jgi:diguanylate cyclase (GGDEF)-like protein/PAS domain S-box-containing protein
MIGMTELAPAARRVEALQQLLLAHPNAVVVAMDDDGLIIEMPEVVPLPRRIDVEARWLIELVVPAARNEIVEAWNVVRAHGISCSPVEFRNGTRADIHWIDVREQYGVHLAVVASDDGAMIDFAGMSDGAEIAPRYGVVRRNPAGNAVEVDAAIEHLVGWSSDALIAAQTLDLIHPEDHERAIENWLETLAAPGRDTRWRGRHRCADGGYLWIEFTNCNLLDDPQYDGVRSEMLDISDEMAMHDELRKSEERFRRLAEALPLGLAQIDADRQITYANQPFIEIAADGSTTVDAAFATTIESDRQYLEAAITGALEHGRDASIEISLGSPTEIPRNVQLVLRSLRGDSSGATGAILVAADVTERTSMRLELERRASFDALTNCYNRSTTLGILESHLASERPAEMGTAAIFVDLDRFKPVNDNFGHAAGDEVLAVVAQRMRSAVRDNDVIGRIGGDEFLVICPNIADIAGAIEIAERIASGLRHEFVIPGSRVSMSASIGIAWADAGDIDADSLVRRADAAMYRAKREATGRPVVDASHIAA